MRRYIACLLIAIGAVCLAFGSARGQDVPEGAIRVTRIWDKAPHNAFTDLVRWNGRFYCTFREGERHVHGEDGKIRVIVSVDDESWESATLIEEDGVDLRDAKLSITPDDRLMVLMGGSYYQNRQLMRRLPRVCFFMHEGAPPTKSAPIVIDERVASENDWLWRVTWHQGVGYGNVYQAYYPPGAGRGPRNSDERPWGLHCVKTTDGMHYDLVSSFALPGSPGEAATLFLNDDRMLVLVRNGETSNLGLSSPPYSNWNWKNLKLPLGGPDLIRLPNGKIILGTRAYQGGWGNDAYTALGELTTDGKFTERVHLPSSGDTSYPGMVLHDGKLWVSYYSSHEGKASIYLAQIPLAELE